MKYCICSRVKEISTGRIGFVVDVSTDGVLVEFTSNCKWLKEYEIIELD